MRNTATKRRPHTIFAISVLLALAAILALSSAVPAQTTVDYDTDGDNYIEVSTHQQLNAIRYDLDGNGTVSATDQTNYSAAFPTPATGMGCAATCVGYELTANLDLDTDGSGSANSADTYWNSGQGWMPIGHDSGGNRYSGDFNGNGHTIDNLFINRPTGTNGNNQGLFGGTDSTTTIESVGVINANVTANEFSGILVGSNRDGAIIACYTTGSITGGSASNAIGGLVGWTRGSITTSYSMASASGVQRVGGLVGSKDALGSVTNSYSTGAVTRVGTDSHTTLGGLLGESIAGTGAVTASVWDTTTSSATSAGGSGAVGYSTTNLQAPTGYTGIYAAWNIDLDNADSDNTATTGRDDPWNFGTSSQYPTLVYHLINDYDDNNDGLIEIDNLAQLNAIRHDLNGNGDATASAYLAAFPRRDSSASGRMGCPSGACTGYELMADLDFDTNGNGVVGTDTGDAYYNSGAGWVAIGHGRDTTNPATRYQATFKGNGHTISNLFINRPHATNDRFIGLFGAIHSNASIESLGVINANVSGGQTVGILVGGNYGKVVACYTTGSVSASNVRVGGLTALIIGSSSSIHSSYSTASVSGSQNAGGLTGFFSEGSITNSYSTGRVSASSQTGGLIGTRGTFDAGAVTASYWDTQTSGQSTSAGSGAVGKTTAELQSPTGYNGIYADWNANIDGQSGADDPWAFGTSSEYPALKYAGLNVFDQGHGDYDRDDDGYIEVNSLAQLDAVRYDLNADGEPVATGATAYGNAFAGRDTRAATRMGCPSGACTGYELTANLDFDENGDGRITAADSTYWDGGDGWDPIGRDSSATVRYAGDFKGNHYTINNLYINRASSSGNTNGDDVGLFGATHTTASIETLGVTNAAVAGGRYVGILIGTSYGDVVACYTTGAVTSTSSSGNNYGGLIGFVAQHTGSPAPFVRSSYSTASVNAPSTLGGLIGGLSAGTVIHSYSTGRVTSSGTTLGGLIGGTGSTYTVTASYWDSQTSGLATSAGGSGAVAKTTFDLQVPDSYSGIYSAWNANLDNVGGGDNPWYFGSRIEYPTLIYDTIVDYDADDDRLIEVENLAQLNVVRYDLYGSGSPASGGDTTAYNAAFPRRVSAAAGRMGCPATCQGYELTANLDFDENGDGAIDGTGDPTYWNSAGGWDPIGDDTPADGSNGYRGAFKGNGHTINNLYINRSGSPADDMGLFGASHSDSRIETLGVTNANITARDDSGIIVGSLYGELVASYATGSVNARDNIGGLTGSMPSGVTPAQSISSSYSTAYVSARTNVGGLVGRIAGGSIANSYAAGKINRASGSNTSFGALVGASTANNSVTDSYWDTLASGCVTGGANGCTTSAGGGEGKTPRELQTVTGYTGIYANWNANLDGESGNDDPWAFGNGMQYPMLKYQGMNLDPQGNQAMGIADNWNAPVAGERLAVCLTPEEYPNRGIVSGQTYHEAWVWEWSANGGTGWTVISGAGDGNNPPTYEYSPTATDVGRYIRAKVKLTDGSFAITRTLGGPVVGTDAAITASGATAGAEIAFINGHAAPQVGRQVVATNILLPGDRDVRSGWQRCPNNTAPHSDCVSIPLRWQVSYTPVAADVGNYLRYYMYYQTSDGTWTRRVTPFTTGVVAAQ